MIPSFRTDPRVALFVGIAVLILSLCSFYRCAHFIAKRLDVALDGTGRNGTVGGVLSSEVYGVASGKGTTPHRTAQPEGTTHHIRFFGHKFC